MCCPNPGLAGRLRQLHAKVAQPLFEDRVAAEGWRLLPQYDFDPATGLWHHREGPAEPRLSLHDISYGADGMEWPRRRTTGGVEHLADYLDQAREILAAAEAPTGEVPDLEVGPDFEHLRWFPLPGEREDPART